MSDKCFYGLEDWEQLKDAPEEVMDRVIENACKKVGEGFDAIADRLEWPIRILGFKRQDVGGERRALSIATESLTRELDNLDETYMDPDSCATEPTEAMKAAALIFGRAIVAEYIPWTCEPTGQTIEYTREQAKELK